MLRNHKLVGGVVALLIVGQASATDPPTLDQRRATLQAAVDARLAAGEKAPSHGADPGYPVMLCEGLDPVPTVIVADNYPGLSAEIGQTLTLLAGSTGVVCGNSAEGSRIVAYREWYCGEKRTACALSGWVDGRPTFAKLPAIAMQLDLSAAATGGEAVSAIKVMLSRLH